MSDINEVRERLERQLAYASANGAVSCGPYDLGALLADHARLQQLANKSYFQYTDDGENWYEVPDDHELVQGLSVGDVYELDACQHIGKVKFRVTKAPDETSDDYEAEEVQS